MVGFDHLSIFRRRREGKTNYGRRRKAILARKPLLTAFVSGKNVTMQVISPRPSGDVVLASASSTELMKYGWKPSRRSIPAAYLTGLILGARAKAKGIADAILYTNTESLHPCGRVAAAAKGAIDSGLRIPIDEGVLPEEERLSGRHIAEHAAFLKEEDQEGYEKRFSGLLKAGLKPEEYVEHFMEVKIRIMKEVVEK